MALSSANRILLELKIEETRSLLQMMKSNGQKDSPWAKPQTILPHFPKVANVSLNDSRIEKSLKFNRLQIAKFS